MPAVNVKGLDDLNRQLRDLADDLPEAVRRAAFAGALVIQGKAQDKAPVEYGNLRASAYTNPTERGAETGFSAKYALWVHEDVEQILKGEPRPSGLGTYWNPGEPKFLENAVAENIETVYDIIEAYLQEAIDNEQPGA